MTGQRSEYIKSLAKETVGDHGRQKIAVYLNSDSMNRIKDLAKREKRSVSKTIVGLMNDGIKWRRYK